MARDDHLGRYKDVYGRLLRLYPRSYRVRFAEPMSQAFADLCNERWRAGNSIRSFAWRIYFDTGIGIVREQSKEMVMNKMVLLRAVLVLVGVGVPIAAAVTAVTLGAQQAGVIPPMSPLEQARALSEGTKETCLPDNEHAITAVKQDDKQLGSDNFNDVSHFEMMAGTAIMDIPVGTNYELTINTFEGRIARGTLTYDSDYGTYNYTMEKLPTVGEWDLVSTVACKQ